MRRACPMRRISSLSDPGTGKDAKPFRLAPATCHTEVREAPACAVAGVCS